MKIFFKGRSNKFDATADYDNGLITILKGSRISESFSQEFKFSRDALNKRNIDGAIKNNILQKDISFKSLSTAAQFVAGYSVNGKKAWKDADGSSIKELESNT